MNIRIVIYTLNSDKPAPHGEEVTDLNATRGSQLSKILTVLEQRSHSHCEAVHRIMNPDIF